MASFSDKSTSVRFDTPQDGIKYCREFRIKAKSLDIWDYINPDDSIQIDWPIIPIAPKISNYPKKLVRTSTRGRSSQASTQTLQGTPVPEEVDLEGHPRTISEITSEGRILYLQEMSAYRFLNKEYKEHRTKVDKIITWITETTSTTIRESCCNEDQTLNVWYKNFLKTGSVYEGIQVVTINNRYQSAITHLLIVAIYVY